MDVAPKMRRCGRSVKIDADPAPRYLPNNLGSSGLLGLGEKSGTDWVRIAADDDEALVFLVRSEVSSMGGET